MFACLVLSPIVVDAKAIVFNSKSNSCHCQYHFTFRNWVVGCGETKKNLLIIYLYIIIHRLSFYVRIHYWRYIVLVKVILISLGVKRFRRGKKTLAEPLTPSKWGLQIRDQFWKGHLAWFILQGSQGSSQLNSAGERNLWPPEQAYGHCLYLTDRVNKKLQIREISRGQTEPWNIFTFLLQTILQKKKDRKTFTSLMKYLCWVIVMCFVQREELALVI